MSKEGKNIFKNDKDFKEHNQDKDMLNNSRTNVFNSVMKQNNNVLNNSSINMLNSVMKQYNNTLNDSGINMLNSVMKQYNNVLNNSGINMLNSVMKQYNNTLNNSGINMLNSAMKQHNNTLSNRITDLLNSIKINNNKLNYSNVECLDNSIKQYNDTLDYNYFNERDQILDKFYKSNKLKHKDGAVTFLDVLGWKGIYKDRLDAIANLQGLIKDTESCAEEITQHINRYEKINGKDIATKIISISDTIVILSEGDDAYLTIKIHSEICSRILKLSMQNYKLPLRGAISYGSYSCENNILIGKAVDEAASWHESTDWIGVILSPTAQFLIADRDLKSIVDYKDIPLKNNYKYIDKCIDWNLDENLIEMILFYKMVH